jgi:hypothetical protein
MIVALARLQLALLLFSPLPGTPKYKFLADEDKAPTVSCPRLLALSEWPILGVTAEVLEGGDER